MARELEKLQEAAGHRFANQELARRALTHSSYVHEQLAARGEDLDDNEQLEFLGDAILGFLVSEWLMERYTDAPEGRLSKLKAHLVSAAHLHEVARQMGLGEFLLLGRGEELSGGREKKTLLVDAFEALIAAVYLDAGIEAARAFVFKHVTGACAEDTGDRRETATDYKSALQEFAQAHKLPPPRYSIVREYGPEHSKTFTVEVRVGRDCASQAEGGSKKSAAQAAARGALQQLREASV